MSPERPADPAESSTADETPETSAATAASGSRPTSRRTVLAAGVPAVVGLLGLSALTNPRPASLGGPTGDQQLTSALAPHLDGHRRVAVAYL
ncbi:MAG: serine hydrolase, partial [Brachybacterium sp.]|nr:serine hydrolase [Brachybacterium sp.]